MHSPKAGRQTDERALLFLPEPRHIDALMIGQDADWSEEQLRLLAADLLQAQQELGKFGGNDHGAAATADALVLGSAIAQGLLADAFAPCALAAAAAAPSAALPAEQFFRDHVLAQQHLQAVSDDKAGIKDCAMQDADMLPWDLLNDGDDIASLIGALDDHLLTLPPLP